jgi:hypothetical protein
MAKTLVEKEICDACGAEVRPGSLFCYNCGGAVSEEPVKPASSDKKENTNHHNSGSDLADNDLKTKPLKMEAVENFENQPVAKPVGKPSSGKLPEKFEDRPIEKPSIQEEAKLKSAASLRRKAKIYQKKTVEVVWEEPENAPNKWFPIVAIVLILLVVGIFYLAMYLK